MKEKQHAVDEEEAEYQKLLQESIKKIAEEETEEIETLEDTTHNLNDETNANDENEPSWN